MSLLLLLLLQHMTCMWTWGRRERPWDELLLLLLRRRRRKHRRLAHMRWRIWDWVHLLLLLVVISRLLPRAVAEGHSLGKSS